MRRAFAKEFLWLLVTLILAFPLALVFLWLLGFTNETITFDNEDPNHLTALYLIGYIISVVSIYVIRILVWAIKLVSSPKEEKK